MRSYTCLAIASLLLLPVLSELPRTAPRTLTARTPAAAVDSEGCAHLFARRPGTLLDEEAAGRQLGGASRDVRKLRQRVIEEFQAYFSRYLEAARSGASVMPRAPEIQEELLQFHSRARDTESRYSDEVDVLLARRALLDLVIQQADHLRQLGQRRADEYLWSLFLSDHLEEIVTRFSYAVGPKDGIQFEELQFDFQKYAVNRLADAGSLTCLYWMIEKLPWRMGYGRDEIIAVALDRIEGLFRERIFDRVPATTAELYDLSGDWQAMARLIRYNDQDGLEETFALKLDWLVAMARRGGHLSRPSHFGIETIEVRQAVREILSELRDEMAEKIRRTEDSPRRDYLIRVLEAYKRAISSLMP